MAVDDIPGEVRERNSHGLKAVARPAAEAAAIETSPTAIEAILKTSFPDWPALLAAAGRARQAAAPMTTLAWSQASTLRSKRGLRKGDDFDAWPVNGALCLYRHPDLLAHLLGWLYGHVARLFAPIRNLRARFDLFLVNLAARLGPLFAIVGIPFALVGFVADAIALAMALLGALPALLLSPLALIREIVSFPFQLAMGLLARLLRTFVLAWLGSWLESSAKIEALLRRYPWLRGVIIGFLRRDRPAYPVLIPSSSVSQAYQVRRVGLTGKRTYVVVVEGDPIAAGIGNWLVSRVKELVLPFYWERTVHILCLPKEETDNTLRAIGVAIGRPIANEA